MGKKGKGRQSGGFTSKSQRAAYVNEIHEQQVQTVVWTRQELAHSLSQADIIANNDANRRRPKLIRLSQLKGILHERQCQEAYQLRQRRQRGGFLPQHEGQYRSGDATVGGDQVLSGRRRVDIHPPGWIVNYGGSRIQDDEVDDDKDGCDRTTTGVSVVPPSLQSQCLKVFAKYIREYLTVMGRNELHAAMSLLPGESLTELSLLLSSTSSASTSTTKWEEDIGDGGGIDDDLATLLGKHPQVQSLCFRAAGAASSSSDPSGHDTNVVDGGPDGARSTTKTLTDRGLMELIPQLMVQEEEDVLDCWDHDDGPNVDNDNDNGDPHGNRPPSPSSSRSLFGSITPDVLQMQGCNLRLRRLELLQCQHLSATVLLQLLEKCSGITHLSLAGSFIWGTTHEDGVEVVSQLPHVLPNLQVLDVTQCIWATTSLLDDVLSQYRQQRQQPLTHEDDNETGDVSQDSYDGHNSTSNPLPRIYYDEDRQRTCRLRQQQQRRDQIETLSRLRGDLW